MPDKLAVIASKFDTDKAQTSVYISNFERNFESIRDKPVKILELGVLNGGSLLMWQEYFSKGLIVGLDLQQNPLLEMPERVRFYQGSQDDGELLDRLSQECAPDGFDIIIDDASHIGTLSRESYRNLFLKHLKPGGIYVIEDWGTGYWNTWPDGRNYHLANVQPKASSIFEKVTKRLSKIMHKTSTDSSSIDPNFSSHNFGMVGFVKELVDEVAYSDMTATNRGTSLFPPRSSMIREMTIYFGHVFIVKA